MPTRVKDGVVPSQPGWAYPTSNPIAFGYNYATLLQNLINYRVASHVEIGDPEQDIENDLCSRQPSICRPTQLSGEEDLAQAERSLTSTARDQIILWNKYLTYYKSTGKYKELETREIATARSQICSSCPQNRALDELGCPNCVVEMNRQSTMFSNGQFLEKSLGYCGAALHDNRTAVWLPKAGLERSLKRVNETVGECWLRQLT